MIVDNCNLKHGFFQIICSAYKQIPNYIQNSWKNIINMDYQIIDETIAIKFLETFFENKYVQAFRSGNTKWKADLLRFCIMSRYSGIYSDVDQLPTDKFNSIPLQMYDTITVIGAHSPPTIGICPLPNGEIHIALLICKSPEPLFQDYMTEMTPNVVASGKPYAINIQSLYAFLCKRFGVTTIEPFTMYTDPIYNRTWYFLKESKFEQGYRILNKDGEEVILSQHVSHSVFM